jgi:hypothetical protein
MNNSRRDDIAAIRAKLDQISIDLGNLKDEEEIAQGNLAENIQAGQKGQRMTQAITALDDAIRCVDEADSYLGIAIK